MPWIHEWVEPEIAFVCTVTSGPEPVTVHVYHTYKNNEWNHRLSYWYTLHDGTNLDADDQDVSAFEFDIRSFPTYDESLTHRDIMQLAINRELCTIEDVFIHVEQAHRGSDAKH